MSLGGGGGWGPGGGGTPPKLGYNAQHKLKIWTLRDLKTSEKGGENYNISVGGEVRNNLPDNDIILTNLRWLCFLFLQMSKEEII